MAQSSKLVYVILDGLGDDPVEAFDGKTPLEAAHTPQLDSLAGKGANGSVTTVGEGIAPESDIAVFAVLGYDPYKHHTGRGPVEAVGADLEVRDGDLAYRVNFATVAESGDGWDIVDRRVGRNLSSEEARALAQEVQEKVTVDGALFDFRATVGHRGVLVLRSDEGPFSAQVENSDPAYGREGLLGVALEVFDEKVVTVAPLEGHDTAEARKAADVTNRWLRAAFEVMEQSEVNRRRRENGDLPGNFVLTRDGGDHVPKLPSFADTFGINMGCFVEMPVEIGIARLTQMGEIEAPTDIPPRQQYEQWAGLALESLDDFDGLYVHIKGPDVPAHDGDHEGKLKSIAEIDTHFFGPLLEKLDLDAAVVAVTADHSTSCARKAHTDGPVPLLIAGRGVAPDSVTAFGERASKAGDLGSLLGVDIMPRLIDLISG
ncbi:MAG: alkaline phosphatase family protein [Actinomycetota bacterium]